MGPPLAQSRSKRKARRSRESKQEEWRPHFVSSTGAPPKRTIKTEQHKHCKNRNEFVPHIHTTEKRTVHWGNQSRTSSHGQSSERAAGWYRIEEKRNLRRNVHADDASCDRKKIRKLGPQLPFFPYKYYFEMGIFNFMQLHDFSIFCVRFPEWQWKNYEIINRIITEIDLEIR